MAEMYPHTCLSTAIKLPQDPVTWKKTSMGKHAVTYGWGKCGSSSVGGLGVQGD